MVSLDQAFFKEKELDEDRKERQLSIVYRWGANKGVGTAQCATGFGKTTLALLMLLRYRQGEGQLNSQVLVVVPTLFLFNQWVDVLTEWGLSSNVKVTTIQSLIKSKHSCSLLILDEIHGYTGQEFSKVFDLVEYKQILGLTATLDAEKALTVNQYCPVVDTVSLRECLDNKWISPFTIYNLGFKLDQEQLEKYNRYSDNLGKYLGLFGHDFNLAIACVSNKAKRVAYAKKILRDPSEVYIAAKGVIDNTKWRKNLLYHAPQKLELAKEIILSFEDRIFITFSQSIQTANDLTEIIPDISFPYHSKTADYYTREEYDLFGESVKTKKLPKSKVKELLISKFKDDRDPIRVINTAKSLDTGANFPKVDSGIILSGTSKFLQNIQRGGRLFRYREGKHAIMVEIYAYGTKDKRWLDSRQREFPRSNVVWIDSVEELVDKVKQQETKNRDKHGV